MKFKQHYINDLILILPNRNFELLKYHYTAIMNIPIMSIVLQDKTEMPLHKLYGMDVEVRNIDLDFIITISMEEGPKRMKITNIYNLPPALVKACEDTSRRP